MDSKYEISEKIAELLYSGDPNTIELALELAQGQGVLEYLYRGLEPLIPHLEQSKFIHVSRKDK